MHLEFILFNPKDDSYSSVALDSKVHIWSIADLQVVNWSDIHDMVTAACYTPDGQCVVHVGREVRRRRLARVRVEAAAGAAVAPEELRNIYLGPGIGSDSFASSIPWTPAPSSLPCRPGDVAAGSAAGVRRTLGVWWPSRPVWVALSGSIRILSCPFGSAGKPIYSASTRFCFVLPYSPYLLLAGVKCVEHEVTDTVDEFATSMKLVQFASSFAYANGHVASNGPTGVTIGGRHSP
ncbi:hypothetical protein BHM03_00034148 [Ensete ventricosum]|nr:hypothetical protein BHM03_00034148 [Ensete ventricosum]